MNFLQSSPPQTLLSILTITAPQSLSIANLSTPDAHLAQNVEFDTIKQAFFKEAFFDLSVVSRLAAFAKDDQLLLVGFEANCPNTLYNKNLKRPKDRKQLKLNECITAVKILPFYSAKSATLFTFVLVGFESGESSG